jgi:hypothetical protein
MSWYQWMTSWQRWQSMGSIVWKVRASAGFLSNPHLTCMG